MSGGWTGGGGVEFGVGGVGGGWWARKVRRKPQTLVGGGVCRSSRPGSRGRQGCRLYLGPRRTGNGPGPGRGRGHLDPGRGAGRGGLGPCPLGSPAMR